MLTCHKKNSNGYRLGVIICEIRGGGDRGISATCLQLLAASGVRGYRLGHTFVSSLDRLHRLVLIGVRELNKVKFEGREEK